MHGSWCFRTRKIKYLEENIGAVNVHLSPDEAGVIRKAVDAAEVHGERYPDFMAIQLFADMVETGRPFLDSQRNARVEHNDNEMRFYIGTSVAMMLMLSMKAARNVVVHRKMLRMPVLPWRAHHRQPSIRPRTYSTLSVSLASSHSLDLPCSRSSGMKQSRIVNNMRMST